MGWQAWVTLVVVIATVWMLARDVVSPALAIVGATIVLLVVGIVDAEEAFAGFSNPAPLTVAALFVLARAVEVTGALEPAVERTLGNTRDPKLQLARVAFPTALSSAFLNNTPIVAMFAPAVAEWAKRNTLPPSRFLIPVSYAAILGGVITAIGTSTNLVVSGLLVEAGLPPLGLFELTPVGLPIALAGCTAIVLLARWLLPDRHLAFGTSEESARGFTVTMRVLDAGPLAGRTLGDAGLRALEGVYAVQLERTGQRIAPITPSEVLRGGDELTFVGDVRRIVDLQETRGLQSTEAHQLDRLPGAEQAFFEAVLGESSPLVGHTLKEVEFRGRFQAAVVAIHRGGSRLEGKLGEVPLRAGDTLLLLADVGFKGRWRESGHFLLIAQTGRRKPKMPGRKAGLTGLITLGLVLLAGAGIVPILEASLMAAVLLVAIGALTPREARGSIDLDVIVVIAASFGLGTAVAASGLADVIASIILRVFEPLGPLGALAGILLATMALTELISNNAAAVLTFPIALSTAHALSVSVRPFAIAVALGASLSFLTPIGYQTNLMVYGLGGYRFGDFTRLGIPINVIVVALALVLIPLVFPF